MGFKPIPDEYPSADEVAEEERIEEFFEDPGLEEFLTVEVQCPSDEVGTSI